jgi:hypothetical protein
MNKSKTSNRGRHRRVAEANPLRHWPFRCAVHATSRRRRNFGSLGHLAHHIEIMKTLLIFVGLATSCLLSGCAHYTKSDTTSRPAACVTTTGTVTNIYTFPVTSTGPSTNYLWEDGTKTGNMTINGTNASVGMVTNLQGTTFFRVTSTGMAPLSYQWYFTNTNIQPATNNTVTIDVAVTNAGTPPSSNTNGNWYLEVTHGGGIAATKNTVTNSVTATNTGAPPLSNPNANWYLYITNDSGMAATNNTVPGYDISPGYARRKRPLQERPKGFEVTNTGIPRFQIAASDVTSASVQPVTGNANLAAAPMLDIVFSSSKAAEFQKFTQEHLNQRVQILVGTNLVIEPMVCSVIPGGEIELSFSTPEAAQAIADILTKK